MKILSALIMIFIATSSAFANMTSETRPDPFGNGYTTTFSDGTTAHTQQDPFGNGTTTRFNDGTTVHTQPNPFGNGTHSTYNNNGY